MIELIRHTTKSGKQSPFWLVVIDGLESFKVASLDCAKRLMQKFTKIEEHYDYRSRTERNTRITQISEGHGSEFGNRPCNSIGTLQDSVQGLHGSKIVVDARGNEVELSSGFLGESNIQQTSPKGLGDRTIEGRELSRTDANYGEENSLFDGSIEQFLDGISGIIAGGSEYVIKSGERLIDCNERLIDCNKGFIEVNGIYEAIVFGVLGLDIPNQQTPKNDSSRTATKSYPNDQRDITPEVIFS